MPAPLAPAIVLSVTSRFWTPPLDRNRFRPRVREDIARQVEPVGRKQDELAFLIERIVGDGDLALDGGRTADVDRYVGVIGEQVVADGDLVGGTVAIDSALQSRAVVGGEAVALDHRGDRVVPDRLEVEADPVSLRIVLRIS